LIYSVRYRLMFYLGMAILLPGIFFMSDSFGQQPDPAAATAPAATDGAGETTTPAASDATSGTQNTTDEGDEDQGDSLIDIVMAGGPVGLLILVLSIAAIALIVEHAMTIRENVLIPAGLADEVRIMIQEGKVSAARKHCRAQPSPMSFVLDAALAETEHGWTEVEKAAEDAIADQSARLFRKIEFLSVIGNIAPMIGLLGTVVGMILAFKEVANTEGAARAADLATGIYLALVTTVEGLIVAIPSLGAFAIFRSRVDHLIAELTFAAQHSLRPLKRGAAAKTASSTQQTTTATQQRRTGRGTPPTPPPPSSK